jgi:hypothetical protein
MWFDVRQAVVEVVGGENHPAKPITPANLAKPAKQVAPAPDGLATLASLAAPALQNPATDGDPETLLSWLRLHGPSTYGAAAVALRWGATRAWQAEARLRASGRVWIDDTGKTRVADGDPEKGVRDDT